MQKVNQQMSEDELSYRVKETLRMEPTDEQHEAIATFAQFLLYRGTNPVMVMKGAAGTGKTSLAGAFVRTMAAPSARK